MHQLRLIPFLVVTGSTLTITTLSLAWLTSGANPAYFWFYNIFTALVTGIVLTVGWHKSELDIASRFAVRAGLIFTFLSVVTIGTIEAALIGIFPIAVVLTFVFATTAFGLGFAVGSVIDSVVRRPGTL